MFFIVFYIIANCKVKKLNMSVRTLLKKFCPGPLRTLYRSINDYRFLTDRQRRKSLSEVGQDFWVFGEVFNGKRNGYFIEIGAADGVSLSNTFLLEQRYHWRGLCIEANPLFFKDLKRIRSATCLNICLDSEVGEVDFLLRRFVGGIVDTDTDNKSEYFVSGNKDIVKMKTNTLSSILISENVPSVIDYLSIDVEGAEERILSKFPFDKYKFKCMTLERVSSKLKEILCLNGYILIKELPGSDAFYVHESFVSDYRKNCVKFWGNYRR